MLRIILSGAPFIAARMNDPPAVVKSKELVTNGTLPGVGTHDDDLRTQPFRAKTPSLAARCTGQEASPGEDAEIRRISWAKTKVIITNRIGDKYEG